MPSNKPDDTGLLTNIGGRDTDKAITDLESHKLPSLFSYRQAYFIGAKAQLDKAETRHQKEKDKFVGEIEARAVTDSAGIMCVPIGKRRLVAGEVVEEKAKWWQSLKEKYLGKE